MNNQQILADAIARFLAWQKQIYPDQLPDEIGGEWEIWYADWQEIYDAFFTILKEENPYTAEKSLLDNMLFAISRDNEDEYIINHMTKHTQWFTVLCKYALQTKQNQAKWQFAAYLPESDCSQEIKDLIVAFANDTDEYVCRRALLAMPKIRPDKVEEFATLFWHRNCYTPELQEYQRIVALNVLCEIKSALLPEYLALAKQDDSMYLVQHANRIQEELESYK